MKATSPLFGVGAGAAAGAAAAGVAAAGVGAAAGAVAGAGVDVAGGVAGACAAAMPPTASSRAVAARVRMRFISVSPCSKCVGAGLAGADADDLLELEDEDLP